MYREKKKEKKRLSRPGNGGGGNRGEFGRGPGWRMGFGTLFFWRPAGEELGDRASPRPRFGRAPTDRKASRDRSRSDGFSHPGGDPRGAGKARAFTRGAGTICWGFCRWNFWRFLRGRRGRGGFCFLGGGADPGWVGGSPGRGKLVGGGRRLRGGSGEDGWLAVWRGFPRVTPSGGVCLGPGQDWEAHPVFSVRRVRGIHAYRSAEKNGEWLTLTEAAATLRNNRHKYPGRLNSGGLRGGRLGPGAH